MGEKASRITKFLRRNVSLKVPFKSFLWRYLAVLGLIVAAYNPEGYSYYHWVGKEQFLMTLYVFGGFIGAALILYSMWRAIPHSFLTAAVILLLIAGWSLMNFEWLSAYRVFIGKYLVDLLTNAKGLLPSGQEASLKVFLGIGLAGLLLFCIYSAWNALPWGGRIIVLAFFSALGWVLYELGLVSFQSQRAIVYLVEGLFSGAVAVGMYFALARRRVTGQGTVYDVDEGA